MQMSISLKGGKNSIERQLIHMKRDGIEKKIQTFLETCGERGIEVAKANAGQYGSLITFTKEVNGNVLTVMATDNYGIHARWITGSVDGNLIYKEVDVSPLMLAEYGSGNFFINRWDNGITRDTSIYSDGSAMPHANESSWKWKEDVGIPWKSSSGESPTMPMYNSYITLAQEIDSIAKSVFGDFDSV